MARKYVNYRVGGSPQKETDDYSVWTNDLLNKIIASKTIIQPGKATIGHQLINSDVVYVLMYATKNIHDINSRQFIYKMYVILL